jgi:hypothetical protein
LSRHNRRGRLLGRATNAEELTAALRACYGYPVVIRSARSRVRLLDADHLRGRSAVSVRVRVRGRWYDAVGVARYTGTRRPDGANSG